MEDREPVPHRRAQAVGHLRNDGQLRHEDDPLRPAASVVSTAAR